MSPTPGRPWAVIDIDGVVADVRHRLRHLQGRRKKWDAFFAAAPNDPAHPEGMRLVGELAHEHEVVFLTGRPEHCRRDTIDWLDRHGLPTDRVLMRPADDRRPAAEVKAELLAAAVAGGCSVAVVVDDEQVLEAMRVAGYPTRRADWETRSTDADVALTEAQELEGRT